MNLEVPVLLFVYLIISSLSQFITIKITNVIKGTRDSISTMNLKKRIQLEYFGFFSINLRHSILQFNSEFFGAKENNLNPNGMRNERICLSTVGYATFNMVAEPTKAAPKPLWSATGIRRREPFSTSTFHLFLPSIL